MDRIGRLSLKVRVLRLRGLAGFAAGGEAAGACVMGAERGPLDEEKGLNEYGSKTGSSVGAERLKREEGVL